MSDDTLSEHESYLSDPRGYAAALPPDRFATPAPCAPDVPAPLPRWAAGLLMLLSGGGTLALVLRGLL